MLYEKLVAYGNSDAYPFHMPGHKRNMTWDADPYQMDITEIDGFDNLHAAQGILLDCQKAAAGLYHAQKSFYLINGSTCGLLAAISASCKKGGKILVARNCHKAVYHAIFLRELCADYVCPQMTSHSILGQVTPEQIATALQKDCYEAVVITSPTYDGVVSDIEEIAKLVHAHGAILIVDEAHGAHFGIGGVFPQSAVTLGADIVVTSLHKTLPALTQTALLHLCSDKVEEKRLTKFLGIYETSSPSYVLMAGIDRCIKLLLDEGKERLTDYMQLLEDFYERVRDLKLLHVLTSSDLSQEEAYAFDQSKLVIETRQAGISGKELSEILRVKYQLELEMASMKYALAMTSMMDTKEGLERLADALFAIDEMLVKEQETDPANVKLSLEESVYAPLYEEKEMVYSIAKVDELPKRLVKLADADGLIAGDFVHLYPPGIPLLCPGERITKELLLLLEQVQKLGFEVVGILSDNCIECV